jgi:hypothetical protein
LRIVCLALTVAGTLFACGHKNVPQDERDASNLLGVLGFGTQADRAEFYARARSREQDLIATCMREAGFRYVPVVAEDVSDSGPGFVEPRTEDEARRNGFGLATQGVVPRATAPADPNRKIAGSLSPNEQEAYYRTLDDIQPDGTVGPDGCRQNAHRQVFGVIEGAFSTLEPAIADMGQRLEADPEFIAINREFSACMAAEGHSYENSDALSKDIVRRYAALNRVAPPPEPTGSDRSRPIQVAADPAAVAAAARYERSVALAYVRCWEPRRDRLHAVFLQYAGQLESSHSAEFEAMRKAMGFS